MLRHMLRTLLCVGVTTTVSYAHAQSISVEPLAPLEEIPAEQGLAAQERIEHNQAEQGVMATIRALDKINGHTQDVELRAGTSAKVFGILVTMQECRYPADNPTGDAYAFLNIRDPRTGATFFNGWMVASSPALNALDHRRYDVWVLRCKSV